MVLVTFRTVQSKLYKIELAPETTIKEAKERFVQEVGGGNPSSIKMIFKAKLLTDDTTIASLNLGEKDFIVVHAPKPSAKPAPPAQTPSPATAPAQPSQTPGQPPEAAPIPTPQGGNLPDVQPIPINQPTHPAQPAQPGNLPGFPGGIPAPGAPDMGAGAGAGGIPEGPEFQEGINSLVELGFPRTDCEAALRAAFGNVDRAAEYLYSGHIPETEEIQQQQNFEKSVRIIAATLLMNPRSLENVIELLEPNDPSFRTNPERALQIFGNLPQERFDLEGIRNRTAQPLDPQQYMQLQAQAAQMLAMQGAPGFQVPSAGGAVPPGPAPGGVPGFPPGPAPGGAPGFPPGPAPGGAPGPAPGGAPGPAPGGAPQGAEALLAQFTPEEQEAIRNLQQLGNFPLLEVIQIYQACDKNAEQAANLLFGGQ